MLGIIEGPLPRKIAEEIDRAQITRSDHAESAAALDLSMFAWHIVSFGSGDLAQDDLWHAEALIRLSNELWAAEMRRDDSEDEGL